VICGLGSLVLKQATWFGLRRFKKRRNRKDDWNKEFTVGLELFGTVVFGDDHK